MLKQITLLQWSEHLKQTKVTKIEQACLFIKNLPYKTVCFNLKCLSFEGIRGDRYKNQPCNNMYVQ